MKTNEDLTYSYLRKHERLEYPFVPIENAKYDSNLEVNREEFITHSNYFVNGCRVKQSYCAMAHYFLIREMLSFKDIKFVTDNSSVLKLSIFKIFNEDFRNRKAVYLISQIQKNLSHEQEVKLISEQKRDLYRWGSLYHGNKDITKLVDLKYKDILKQGLFNDIEIDGKIYISGPKKPFKIPLDNTTDGIRSLQVISPIDHMSDNHIIKMFKLSSFRNHNFFIISLRRAIQALDRPNISARAHGRRHYLYTGKNPKYIQYFITIFRVYYNFVFLDKHGKTKAMREGIATKGFTLKDIIYFSR